MFEDDHGGGDASKNERQCFVAALQAVDRFLDEFVTAIEGAVDPHNPQAMARFIGRMTRDNVVRNALPKYAAGTGFAKTWRAMALLSNAATNTCTREMATAAHRALQYSDDTHRAQHTDNTANTDNATPVTNESTDTDTTPIPLYLAAARAKPRAINRLPTPNTPNHATCSPPNTHTYTAKLRTTAARLTDSLTGHEEKHLMQVTSDVPLASPSHLRAIFKVSGITRPLAVIPTDNPNNALVCAAGTTLDQIATGYANFAKVSKAAGRSPPTLHFERIEDPACKLQKPDDARLLLRALRREIRRLEAEDCTWRPRVYFARRIREFENSVYTKCFQLDANATISAMPPPPTPPLANKRPRWLSQTNNSAGEDDPSTERETMDTTDTAPTSGEPVRQ